MGQPGRQPEFADLRVSLRALEGELARYRRTGRLVHLEHAARALEEVRDALYDVRKTAQERAREVHGEPT
jgi:hypothetical protein